MFSTLEVKQAELKPDVITLGAGPVGLWTSIQVKLKNPEKSVIIFEKYPAYKRKQQLIVDQESLVTDIKDIEFKTLTDSISGKIQTAVIEERLLAFAKRIVQR